MTHQFRRSQLSSGTSLNGANIQENVVGVLAILTSSFTAPAFILKLLSQLWTYRCPMNCTISFSNFKVNMSYQTCYLFFEFVYSRGLPLASPYARISFHFLLSIGIKNFGMGCSSDSIVFSAVTQESRAVSRRLYDSPNSRLSGEQSGSLYQYSSQHPGVQVGDGPERYHQQ